MYSAIAQTHSSDSLFKPVLLNIDNDYSRTGGELIKFINGYATFPSEDSWHLIDSTGRKVENIKSLGPILRFGDWFTYSEPNQIGINLLNLETGEKRYRGYTYVGAMEFGYSLIVEGREMGLIDKNGNEVISPQSRIIVKWNKAFARCNPLAVIPLKTKKAIPSGYTFVKLIDDDFALFKKEGLTYLFDENLDLVFPESIAYVAQKIDSNKIIVGTSLWGKSLLLEKENGLWQEKLREHLIKYDPKRKRFSYKEIVGKSYGISYFQLLDDQFNPLLPEKKYQLIEESKIGYLLENGDNRYLLKFNGKMIPLKERYAPKVEANSMISMLGSAGRLWFDENGERLFYDLWDYDFFPTGVYGLFYFTKKNSRGKGVISKTEEIIHPLTTEYQFNLEYLKSFGIQFNKRFKNKEEYYGPGFMNTKGKIFLGHEFMVIRKNGKFLRLDNGKLANLDGEIIFEWPGNIEVDKYGFIWAKGHKQPFALFKLKED